MYKPQHIVVKIFHICYSHNYSIRMSEEIYMYDSFYKITEQQQKLANLYNQIYTPELLKMQQTYSDMITRLQPSIAPILQNVSEISALAEQAMWMRDFDTEKFLSTWNNIIGIDNQFVQNMSNTLANMNVGQFVTMAQRMVFPTEAIVNYSQVSSIVQMESIISNLYDTIQSMPDSVWETLSEEEGYSKKEIQAELEIMKTEEFPITDVKGLTPDQVKEKMWVWLWENHPKIATVLVVVVLTLGTIGLVDIVNEYFIPMGQNTIVTLQGKEDIFFIKVDSAKLYTEPNSHSKVITKILYADEVTRIDSVKMWNKVIYVNPDGEEITGWIAKKNLMTYKDYKFNSDDLYNLE